MTPVTISEAVYEIGQAAVTWSEARSGGVDLGRSLAGQTAAMGAAREMLNCASDVEIESTLRGLAEGKIPNHAAVARVALVTWRQHLIRR